MDPKALRLRGSLAASSKNSERCVLNSKVESDRKTPGIDIWPQQAHTSEHTYIHRDTHTQEEERISWGPEIREKGQRVRDKEEVRECKMGGEGDLEGET